MITINQEETMLLNIHAWKYFASISQKHIMLDLKIQINSSNIRSLKYLISLKDQSFWTKKNVASWLHDTIYQIDLIYIYRRFIQTPKIRAEIRKIATKKTKHK